MLFQVQLRVTKVEQVTVIVDADDPEAAMLAAEVQVDERPRSVKARDVTTTAIVAKTAHPAPKGTPRPGARRWTPEHMAAMGRKGGLATAAYRERLRRKLDFSRVARQNLRHG